MADDTHALLQRIEQHLQKLARGQELLYEQVEALLNLHAMLSPLNAPLPAMRKWAISPDFGILLYSLLSEYHPMHVVELGGGVSTIITGYYCTHAGVGTVRAFDHHPLYAQLARKQLDAHQLIDVARVTHAPLMSIVLSDQAWEWYDPNAFSGLYAIDFLTIDGPPQQDNPLEMARYPALPLLYDRLSSGAIILVDDYHREHEQRCVARWLDEFDLVHLQTVDNEKGAVVLQKP
ncbi:MAG: class I SAM-dependent methyltransferase [Anaerolineae bacterium]